MKKFFILFLSCLFCASTAGAWGLLDVMVSDRGNPYIYKKSFLYYVLTTKKPKVRVCVSAEGTNPDPVRQKIVRDYFVQSTQEAFDDLLSFIRTQLGEQAPVQAAASGKRKKKAKKQPAPAPEFARKAEFADIVAALPRRIELQVVNPNGEDCNKEMKGKYDLRIKSLGNFKYGSIAQQFNHTRGTAGMIKGLFDKDASIWVLALPGNDDYSAYQLAKEEAHKKGEPFMWGSIMDYTMERVARHEIAHFFGLADQYSDQKNMHKVRSLLRTEPSSVVFGGLPSVMAESETFTCDDLEGFINAIDFIWGMEGKTSPRVQNGWKSLCGKPYLYLQGIPVKDSADLAKVQEYLRSWKQAAKEQYRVVQLGQNWRAYLEKVRKMAEEHSESLYTKRQQMRGGLDKAGLALSAESQYLEQKVAKITAIIEQQIEPAEAASRAGKITAQQLNQLEQDLSQYRGQYTPDSPVLDAKGLLTAKPYDDDFSSVTYPCLVCGKPVGKENGFLNRDVKIDGKVRPYHVHTSCAAQSSAYYSKLDKHYRHKGTRRTVPTWAELTQTQGDNPLLAQLAQRVASGKKTPSVALDFSKRENAVSPRHSTPTVAQTRPMATPKNGKSAPVVSAPKRPVVKKGPAAATSKPAESSVPKAKPVVDKAAASGAPKAKPVSVKKAVPAAPKATCVVCRQKMADGTFYTDSVGRTVHKHSLCAYRFFKRFHKTDDASLSRYSDYYFFSMPNDVVQAKADMQKLGLTFANIRRYRASEEASVEAFKKSLETDKAAKAQARAKAEKCRVFQRVMPADVQAFEKKNKAALARMAQKEKNNRSLSKHETLLKRHYEQLKANLALTKECQN